jgi:hypothetical protein
LPNRSRLALAIIALLAIFFVAGLIRVLQLRFDTGSVYQEYSTLRPDPLGAKVLFDSLDLLGQVDVERNMQDLESLSSEPKTLVFLGVYPSPFINERWLQEAAKGSRVVVAFVPVFPRVRPQATKPVLPDLTRGKLGITVRQDEVAKAPDAPGYASGVPPKETAAFFDDLSPEWKVRRLLKTRPVAVERPWKQGSIVFITDSYRLSNEALTSVPDANEIAWMIGTNKKVVFDETHLGMQEAGSVVGLMRRYGLQTFIASFLVLAALFVWSRAATFLPDLLRTHSGEIEGRGSSEGLLALLERSIEPAKLIDTCVCQWVASPAGRTSRIKDDVQQAAKVWKGNPVDGYEAIRRQLEKANHPWRQG